MSRGEIYLRWPQPGLAWIILDNPNASNAISISMMEQLEKHCLDICSQAARVVLVSAENTKTFCAGGDLHDVRNHLVEKKSAEMMCDKMSRALSSFREHDIFVLMALEGPAVGGGAELTTYGDCVIASEDVYIRFVHSRLGVSPGWGGAMRLIEKTGIHNARNILLGAQKYQNEEALRLQLIDKIVEKGKALTTAMKLAEHLASMNGVPQEMMSFCREPSKAREKEMFLSLWGEEIHKRALGLHK